MYAPGLLQPPAQRLTALFAVLLGNLICPIHAQEPATVQANQGQAPVIANVDVLIVGGTSGAVGAAIEAAEQGAEVFLIAPKTYLGEDICGTSRLWMPTRTSETADSLESALVSSFIRKAASGPRIEIPSYSADLPSASVHPDSKPPRKLTDGGGRSASNESVQYDGDVTLVTDLGKIQPIGRLAIHAYQRDNDFEVDEVVFSLSLDGKQWTALQPVPNPKRDAGGFEGDPIEIATDELTAGTTARFVQAKVRRTPEASRLLLAEFTVHAPTPEQAEPEEFVLGLAPMRIKTLFEKALMDSGVQYLYGSFACETLLDEAGDPVGLLIANKSGVQAILASTIIDASPQGYVAGMAGAEFREDPGGSRKVSYVNIGGEALKDPARVEGIVSPDVLVESQGQLFDLHAYEFTTDNSGLGFPNAARLEQEARDRCWTFDSLASAEDPFHVPPIRLRSQQATGATTPADPESLAPFQPLGMKRIWVLSGAADLDRDLAERMLTRPVDMLRLGRRIGAAAAGLSPSLAQDVSIDMVRRPTKSAAGEESRHGLEVSMGAQPPRFDRYPAIPLAGLELPVWGRYDVIVAGGGTAGAPAAIGAARQGAKTLVIEYLHGMGGVGTQGLISKYYYGNIVGFTQEIDAGVKSFGPDAYDSGGWNVRWKMEWYRREVRKAGGEVWFGAMVTGAVREGDRVQGLVVSTPYGSGVVLADCVVDATGSAAVAAAAGAPCVVIGADDVAVQGSGLPPVDLGVRYTNTDYSFFDDTDILDMQRAFIVGREKYKNAFDLGQLIDTRERRRIIGDFNIDPLDIWNHRTYPDTIVIHRSNFDTHGFTTHPVFLLKPPDREAILAEVPLRSLLPQGLEGILVTGLAISAHRDAMPVIRMQPGVQNQGYAAGVAAAMAAANDCPVRAIDVRALQEHLVSVGNLPEKVLNQGDSFPIPEDQVRAAVISVGDQFKGLETVLCRWDIAHPWVVEAYRNETDADRRLHYAHLLAVQDDPIGYETLAAAIQAGEWDAGWRYTGMGQFGMSMSRMDSLLVGLGKTGRPEAIPIIAQKAGKLEPDHEFSHFRAIAMACEAIKDVRAAECLESLLQLPGVQGHSYPNLQAALANNPTSSTDTSTRNNSLREIVLARALFRCGDPQKLGLEILEEYARDMRGYYARHAQAVLQEAGVDQ
ncbi:MAG: FAD-dependent oxidoreductase [Verrucomicrobiota bacterium]|nr:FAD-dependent oxidoreductase [Verrucomicrobiota bacterium]